MFENDENIVTIVKQPEAESRFQRQRVKATGAVVRERVGTRSYTFFKFYSEMSWKLSQNG